MCGRLLQNAFRRVRVAAWLGCEKNVAHTVLAQKYMAVIILCFRAANDDDEWLVGGWSAEKSASDKSTYQS